MTGRLLVIAGALAALLPFGAMSRANTASADLAAARELQVLERWAPSESLATAALARLESETAPDSLEIAEALHLIAVAKWRTVGYVDGSGLRAASRSLGIRERRLGANHLDVADAHSLLSRFLLGIDRGDSALIHVRRALDIRTAQLAPDDTLIAKTWDQVALVQRGRQEMRGALESWNYAIEIRKRVHGPEHPEVARLLAQTGVPWMELGDLVRARQALEEALAMFERTGGRDHPGRWIPLNILSDVESHSGNRARSVDLIQEALRVVRIAYGENSREALTLRTNLGIMLNGLGDFAGSRSINAKLLPLMEAQYGPTHPRTLSVRENLAVASHNTGDTAAAMHQYRELEKVLAARPGPPLRQLTLVLVQQAELLHRQGREEESRSLCERALRTERSGRLPTGDYLAGAQQLLILVHEAIGDTAALDSARRELVKIAAQYPISAPEDVPYFSARAVRRLGRMDEAWTLALEADRLSRERLRVNLKALPDRRALLLTAKEDNHLELVLALSKSGDGNQVRTAWDRLVRSRGLVRAEAAHRRLPNGFESDTAIVGAHGRWMNAQHRFARRLVTAGGSSRDSAARAALEVLRISADDAEAAYAGELASRGAKVAPAEVGVAEVLARLKPGEALVSCYGSRKSFRASKGIFAADSGEVIAFVARGGSDAVERISLGPASSLRAALDPWRERLAVSPGARSASGGRSERECRRLGRVARGLTWDRLAPHVAGATDVFIVADGPLLDLPWQALPDGAKGYLVEAGPRLHLLHAERDLIDPPAAAKSVSLLAVGAPDYDHGTIDGPDGATQVAALVRSAPDPCADGRPTAFAPLPGSGAEAEAVARSWRVEPGHEATVLTGAGANERAFKREARGRAIIHLATHGVVASDTCVRVGPGLRGVGGVEPLSNARRKTPRPRTPDSQAAPEPAPSPWMARRVWLALAGANHAPNQTDENEGILTAEEVITLDLDGTDWVVLSACHSGVAEAWSRDGTLGMRRAFDLAGARTVFASQWAVEDAATREWMDALYAARARGATSAATALESASRVVLEARRREGRSTHPFYWAAFSASGE